MQPLAYFAARALLGWLQFVEKEGRAFTSNALLLVATGAAHCWAVVYALFIAIHTRAMRFDGYHEGYIEHLPFFVSWTETLSVASIGVWWAAGFTMAAIRIVDDDSRGLPVDAGDVNIGFLFKLLRSQKLQDILATAQTVSCIGLFASIILLCIAMALMAGGITACEVCLCFVAVGFALPHAVLACRRVHMLNPKKNEDSRAIVHGPAAEAASQEAAALGPQLAVLLALADSPGHAYLWQNFIYLVAAVAYVAAVAACGQSPPKVGDVALPPETPEFITCTALDAAASIALVLCFPHLNTWNLWALVVLVGVLFAVIYFDQWRDLIIDLLDDLFVVRSDSDKMIPGEQRQRLRKAAWAATLACAAVAMWDIMLHPVQEGVFEPAVKHDGNLPDFWDRNSLLLLRWQAPPAQFPGEKELLSMAEKALDVNESSLTMQAVFPSHRLLLFKVDSKGYTTSSVPLQMRWKTALPTMNQIADSTFPAALNVTLCLRAAGELHKLKEKVLGTTESSESTTKPPMSADFIEVVGTSTDAQDAYMAACNWWMDALGSLVSAEGKAKQGEKAEGGTTKSEQMNTAEPGEDLA